MLTAYKNISPRWIKLIPAVKYSSIGKDRLKDLAKKGIIIGFSDPDNKPDIQSLYKQYYVDTTHPNLEGTEAVIMPILREYIY